MNCWVYVFITPNPGSRKAVQAIWKIPGVIKVDALLGTPDVIALVEGSDLRERDAVIDQIVELPEMVGTETKLARWIE